MKWSQCVEVEKISLTDRLSVRMTDMNVKWSVSGVNKKLMTRAVVFVAFLN